jgi:hypothetical protein
LREVVRRSGSVIKDSPKRSEPPPTKAPLFTFGRMFSKYVDLHLVVNALPKMLKIGKLEIGIGIGEKKRRKKKKKKKRKEKE